MRRKINQFIPPVSLSFIDRYIRKRGYFGDFSTWQEAQRASTGYDGDQIIEKVKAALLKVKSGEAVYERDSVLFDEIHYSWPLLAGLLWVASQNENKLTVVDFGGSLGSTFFQNRKFLEHLSELRWHVIEQKKFVVCGKEFFQDAQLNFHYSIDECLELQRPDVILFSSVLPYLEKPYDLLTEAVSRGVEYLIIDRTPLLEGRTDRLTVQKVPAELYPASYPAWIFGRDHLLGCIRKEYDLVAEFDALAGRIDLDDACAYDKGFIFRKKS